MRNHSLKTFLVHSSNWIDRSYTTIPSRIRKQPRVFPKISFRKSITMAANDGVNVTATDTCPPLSELKKEASQLEEFLKLPSVSRVDHKQTKAGGPIHFTFYYSQRKLASNGKSTSIVTTTLANPKDLNTFGPCSSPIEIKDSIISSSSPSGKKSFTVYKGEGGDVAIFEIWEGSVCMVRVNVPNAVHGDVINDGLFSGGVSWSNDESKIAYVADAPRPQSLPEWGKHSETSGNGEKTVNAAAKSWKGVDSWEQNWGERLVAVKRPTLFIFDLKESSVLSFKNLPEDRTNGQPVWTPNDLGLVFTSWSHVQENFNNIAMKLGFLHCYNRPCFLYYVPLDAVHDAEAKPICLTQSFLSAFSPGFSPNGEKLVFFSAQHATETGIHESSHWISYFEWKKVLKAIEQKQTDFSSLVHSVLRDEPRPKPPHNFPGLYQKGIDPMSNNFIDNERIIQTSSIGFQMVILLIHLKTGDIQLLTPIGMTEPSHALLCHSDGVLIAIRASFTTVPCLVMRQMDSDQDWMPLDLGLQPHLSPEATKEIEDLEQFQIRFFPEDYPNGKPENPVECEAVFVKNKHREGPRPTVIALHGGPHGNVFQAYPPGWMVSLSMGIGFLTVNFRGSLAYGTDFTMALPGHIGNVDVKDCKQALDIAIEKGYVDPERVAVSGGSHGGFLTGHMIGQYPDTFKCAIVRNPVFDLAHMIYVTDIPDWVFVESFGPEGTKMFTTVPSSEQMKAFYEKSPIFYVDRVKTPLLVMLGSQDLRTPQSQSLRYVMTLKSRKDHPEVRVVVFSEDSHSLDKPQTEFENYMNIIWWFKKHGISE